MFDRNWDLIVIDLVYNEQEDYYQEVKENY